MVECEVSRQTLDLLTLLVLPLLFRQWHRSEPPQREEAEVLAILALFLFGLDLVVE